MIIGSIPLASPSPPLTVAKAWAFKISFPDSFDKKHSKFFVSPVDLSAFFMIICLKL